MRAELGGLKMDVKEMQRSFESGFAGIKSSAASMGKSLAGAFAFGSVVTFGKHIVDLGGKLQDLSEQTGISAQLLSGMKSTLEESGSSVETFAKAIFTAQKNLGAVDDEGDKVAKVVKRLGLNLDELRNAPTEKFLQLIGDALAKIENPLERNALGAQILGKSWQEAGPAIIATAGKLAELKKSGLSDADIKRLDDIGDSLTRLKNTVMLWAAGPVAQGIEAILKLLRIVPLAPIEQMGKSLMELDAATSQLAGLLGKSLGEVTAMSEQELQQLAQYPSRIGKLAQAIIDAKKQISISDAQVRAGDAPKGKIAPFQGVGTGDEAKKKTDAFFENLRKQSSALGGNLTELTLGPIAALTENLERAFGELKKTTPLDQVRFDALKRGIIAATLELQKLKAALGSEARNDQDRSEWLTVADDLGRVADKAREAAKALADARTDALAPMFSQDSAEWLTVPEDVAQDIAKRGEKAWQPWEQAARGAFGSIETGLRGVMMGTQSMGQAFANMGLNMVLALNEVIFKLLVIEPLMKSLKESFTSAPSSSGGGGGSWLGTLIGLGGSLLGGMFGGAVAAPAGGGSGSLPITFQAAQGGIVTRPSVGLVGEAGPEAIIPLSKMRSGGLGGNVYNIDARGAQRGVSAEIRRALRETEDRAVERSKGAVKDTRQRSNNWSRAFSARK